MAILYRVGLLLVRGLLLNRVLLVLIAPVRLDQKPLRLLRD